MSRSEHPACAAALRRTAVGRRRLSRPLGGRALHRLLLSFGRRGANSPPHPSLAPAPEQTADTQLGQLLTPRNTGHPGQSGILSLQDAEGAFVARLLLAATAERTLDVQYYIWNGDITGTLLMHALYQAAERGVRVRLLLDDNGTAGLDGILAAYDAHPRIEIRLFNPFVVRRPKLLGYLTHFRRANRRMHNKSMTADNQATIVGGRNIGDEYFGASSGIHFTDMDVLAVGAVVPDVSRDFDRYWSCASAVALDRVLPSGSMKALQFEVERATLAAQAHQARRYLAGLANCEIFKALADDTLPMRWSTVTMVSDDPDKGRRELASQELMVYRLKQVMGNPVRRLDLVSPYFVPTGAGVSLFAAMVRQGVQVRVLTNALEATDVAAVHAGYARRRRALLKAGVILYEMRRQHDDVRRRNAGPFGSSGSSLHAKTFALDDRQVFVGSFNFDPRSARLNTEMGFVIDDAVLAQAVDRAFDEEVPDSAYAVTLDDAGRLCWRKQKDGQEIRHYHEPGTGWFKRLGIAVLSRLPIEWLL